VMKLVAVIAANNPAVFASLFVPHAKLPFYVCEHKCFLYRSTSW
jgi:hypothetical protein